MGAIPPCIDSLTPYAQIYSLVFEPVKARPLGDEWTDTLTAIQFHSLHQLSNQQCGNAISRISFDAGYTGEIDPGLIDSLRIAPRKSCVDTDSGDDMGWPRCFSSYLQQQTGELASIPKYIVRDRKYNRRYRGRLVTAATEVG